MQIVQGIICVSIVVLFSLSTFGEEKSSAQFDLELSNIKEKEVNAREKIAQEQAEIERLKRQISETESTIEKTIQTRYSALGINETDIKNAEDEIAFLVSGFNSLNDLSSVDLLNKKELLSDFENRFLSLGKKPVSNLKSIKDKLLSIEQDYLKIRELFIIAENSQKQDILTTNAVTGETSAASQKSVAFNSTAVTSSETPNTFELVTSYIVKNYSSKTRESLSIIAGYPEIYGDPSRWFVIYKANKKEIDNNYMRLKKKNDSMKISKSSDLIFPGQELIIPR
jgi:nucleoid-associated protein YgaU